MARKSTPQPLTMPDRTAVDEQHDFIDGPSPLSPKSPTSPRSPFRFNTSKKAHSEQPPMQTAELHSRTAIPASPRDVSLSTILPSSANAGEGDQEKQERPARSGFFSNYKASKSSSRLQNAEAARKVSDDSMSRDTDRPAMPGKVSSKEFVRTGTTALVSSLSSSDAGN